MTIPSTTHLVLIPSYNPGRKVLATVRAARAQWTPVWVVVDGSTDGSAEWLTAEAAADPGLRVVVLPHNQGKGSAVLQGITLAAQAGFTHALTMDSDGQHPETLIPTFMAASQATPGAMVLGKPVFGAEAPALRVNGRKVSNGWANLETLWMGVGGSFDVWSGQKKRAPRWMGALQIEWLYRLVQEPSRWRRMLALPQFALAVLNGNPPKPAKQKQATGKTRG